MLKGVPGEITVRQFGLLCPGDKVYVVSEDFDDILEVEGKGHLAKVVTDTIFLERIDVGEMTVEGVSQESGGHVFRSLVGKYHVFVGFYDALQFAEHIAQSYVVMAKERDSSKPDMAS